MSQEPNRTSRAAPNARTIAETQIIRLALADQHALAQAMISPPAPGPALLRAAEAYRGLIRRSE